MIFKSKYKGLNKEDIIVSSFPKTGSTYTRFVLSNIINLLEGDENPVTFHTLGSISPEVGKDDLTYFKSKSDKLPRFVKTHEEVCKSRKYIDIPSVYIIRDPRDTMISYYHYISNRKDNNFSGSFEDFVKHPEYGIESYNKHVEGWSVNSQWIFTYEELMQDSYKLFSRLINQVVKEDISKQVEQVLSKAIDFSSPNNVKKIELEQSRPGASENFSKEFKFVRNASLGQWKNDMDSDIANYIITKSCPILQLVYQE